VVKKVGKSVKTVRYFFSEVFKLSCYDRIILVC